MLDSPLTYIALLAGVIYLTYKSFTSEEYKSTEEKWYTYSRYIIPSRLLFTFLLIAIVFFFGTRFGVNSDYAIAYALLIVGVFFFCLSCAVFFSKKFNAWVWRHTWQKEPETDRNWLAGSLFFLAAAFAFGFFLFYPPFISIG